MLILLKIRWMKKLAYISGAIFSSLTLLGILFKIMHLQGAPQLFIAGMAGLALVFIPSFAKYRYNKNK
jgi:hypothetical protein